MAHLLATHGALAVSRVIAREKATNLARAVTTNREIGMAMGVLMTTYKVTEDQAFDLLRIASQGSHRKMNAHRPRRDRHRRPRPARRTGSSSTGTKQQTLSCSSARRWIELGRLRRVIGGSDGGGSGTIGSSVRCPAGSGTEGALGSVGSADQGRMVECHAVRTRTPLTNSHHRERSCDTAGWDFGIQGNAINQTGGLLCDHRYARSSDVQVSMRRWRRRGSRRAAIEAGTDHRLLLEIEFKPSSLLTKRVSLLRKADAAGNRVALSRSQHRDSG